MIIKIRSLFLIVFYIVGLSKFGYSQSKRSTFFPDGTKIPDWFLNSEKIKLNDLGKSYNIVDFGAVNDSSVLQTQIIQKTIDTASSRGGGVIVIPKGIFLSGALFFKPNTHLYVSENAVLKGSDNIADYPNLPSRIEGQSINYFAALVNAYNVDGFTISGHGTIDGNGLKYWEAFWQRRKENPKCTNLEVSRPRLVFIWHCNNVQVQDVKLHNSGFWTSHYYQCKNVKILDLHIASPHEPVKAPSTDAIDVDVCSNVLIKGCYMAVNDDAIALKGGKGPYADADSTNGENTNIIIEDCNFGFCHAALTCGSESIHNKNIVLRNCYVNEAKRLLWLKMRPDTPQKYEYITVEDITGQASSLIFVKPWTQFYDLKGRKDVPLSYSENITLRNIELKCDVFFDIDIGEYDRLSNFIFDNLKIEAKNSAYDKGLIKGITLSNVVVNKKFIE
jgi:polygalacturonase